LAEYQRQQEASESAAKRSRIATDFNRGIARHITALEIVDPNDLDGGVITVARQTRNDPLGGLHARKSIDEAQYQAGRAFQSDFETAERGPCAIDFTREAVDGGRTPEPITEAQRRAALQLKRVFAALDQDGSALAHDVLIHGLSFRQIASARGFAGRRWEEFFGSSFHIVLHKLSYVYGFATEKTGKQRMQVTPIS
jgi:hypothetical protein